MASNFILLVHHTPDKDSKKYYEFPIFEMCLDCILKIFEDDKRSKLGNKNDFAYDLKDLFDFLDSLTNIKCLLSSGKSNKYTQYDINWIKSKLYLYLSKQVIQDT